MLLTGPEPQEIRRARVKLSLPASAVLDATRAAAALYVVLHHLFQRLDPFRDLPLALRFGQEAVIVFFLLSGFVIFANERDRSTRLASYAWRRLRRIYPILLSTLLISVAVSWLDGSLAQRFSWRQLWTTLLCLQDTSALKPGVISDPFMGNTPLWSLSYEAGFYALFPLVMVAWRINKVLTSHAVGALGCFAYMLFAWSPNHFTLVVAYFPIWWIGAFAADKYSEGERSWSSLSVPLSWLALEIIIAAVVLLVRREAYTSPGAYPALPLRHFCGAFLIVVIGFSPLAATLGRFVAPLRNVFRLLAAISFGVYALHYPLLITSNFSSSWMGLALSVLALISLAAIVDVGAARFFAGRKFEALGLGFHQRPAQAELARSVVILTGSHAGLSADQEPQTLGSGT